MLRLPAGRVGQPARGKFNRPAADAGVLAMRWPTAIDQYGESRSLSSHMPDSVGSFAASHPLMPADMTYTFS